MHTAVQKKKVPAPTMFVIGTTGDTSPNFIPGLTTCKECKSHKLDYYKYLDDAKCQCGQWQNEEPLTH